MKIYAEKAHIENTNAIDNAEVYASRLFELLTYVEEVERNGYKTLEYKPKTYIEAEITELLFLVRQIQHNLERYKR